MGIAFIDLKSQYQKIKTSVDKRILDVLDSCQFILGAEVEACEEKLKEYCGANFALTCASGTDALLMALMALDIGYGDEVIVPGFSFFASAEVVSLVGAKPVFVDVNKSDFNIDISDVRKSIGPKTKAIIAVGLYGQMADMEELNELCSGKPITLIEDAAQCFGASYKGQKSCSVSRLAATSFFPAKPLGCYGDGGAIFTSDEKLYEIMRQIRVHGDRSRYEHVRMGINGRMDSIQCAVVSEKLEIFDWEIEQRNRVADIYMKNLGDLKEIILPIIGPNRTMVWAQFTILVEERERFIAYMKEQGIPTSVHYPKPIYKQKVYKGANADIYLENCEYLSQRVVSLPMHPYLKEEELLQVTNKIRSFFNA